MNFSFVSHHWRRWLARRRTGATPRFPQRDSSKLLFFFILLFFVKHQLMRILSRHLSMPSNLPCTKKIIAVRKSSLGRNLMVTLNRLVGALYARCPFCFRLPGVTRHLSLASFQNKKKFSFYLFISFFKAPLAPKPLRHRVFNLLTAPIIFPVFLRNIWKKNWPLLWRSSGRGQCFVTSRQVFYVILFYFSFDAVFSFFHWTRLPSSLSSATTSTFVRAHLFFCYCT